MAAAELQKAVRAIATGSANLSAAVSGQVFFGEARKAATMPYIVFHFISGAPTHTFREVDTFEGTIVQFSIFDDDTAIAGIEDIYDKLKTAFDRTALSYDSKTAIGCLREGDSGPVRLEDCWMKTVDYRITYK